MMRKQLAAAGMAAVMALMLGGCPGATSPKQLPKTQIEADRMEANERCTDFLHGHNEQTASIIAAHDQCVILRLREIQRDRAAGLR